MNIKTKSAQETLHTLCASLDEYRKLYFTRFGDGEIYSMMGKTHRNYNASPELSLELKESLSINSNQYLIAVSINYPKEKGMSNGVFAPFKANAILEEYIFENKFPNNEGVYENPIVFQYYSVFKSKLVFNFFEKYIRPKSKMFIGCTPKNIAEKLYGPIDYYVNIPPKHAYDSINLWWPKVVEHIDDVQLVIPSAGAASNVINKRLWVLGKEVHSLDIGSIVDAIDYNITRTWIRLKGHKIQKILPKKFRERRLTKLVIFVLKDIKYFFRKMIK